MSDNNSDKYRIVTLPNFGKVYVIPFLNVGTLVDIEKMMPSQPSVAEIINTVFSGRAQVEEGDGTLRGVTKEEIKKLSVEDRATFAQEFLKVVEGDAVKRGDFDSPEDALSAYVLAELRAIQDSQKEFSAMLKAGFSDKTIGLYKESKNLAEQLVAANKFPSLAKFLKSNSSLYDIANVSAKLRDEINSPAIKAALQVQQTFRWKAPMGNATPTAVLDEKTLNDGSTNVVGNCNKLHKDVADLQENGSHEGAVQRAAPAFNVFPKIKLGEQIIGEQIDSLNNNLGNRMDRVGNAITGIALQQENTNSIIISALGDMRSKWKEDVKSSRVALWVAVGSLVFSSLLAGYSIYQNRESNISGDRYQSQITSLFKQQNELAETQRQLLDQIAKSNAKLSTFRGEEKK